MSARPAGGTLLKRALFHSGLLALARLARQRVRGVILRYHALTDGATTVPYAAPDICLPVDGVPAPDGVRQARLLASCRSTSWCDALERRRAAAAAGARHHLRRRLRRQPPPRRSRCCARSVCRRRCTSPPAALDGGDAVLGGGGARARAGAPRRRARRCRAWSRSRSGRAADRARGAKALDARAGAAAGAGARRAASAAAAAAAGVDLHAALARHDAHVGADPRAARGAAGRSARTPSRHCNVALVAAERGGARDRSRRATRSRRAIGAPVRPLRYPNTGGQHRYFSPEVGGDAAASRLPLGASRRGPVRCGPAPIASLLPRLGVSPRLGAGERARGGARAAAVGGLKPIMCGIAGELRLDAG